MQTCSKGFATTLYKPLQVDEGHTRIQIFSSALGINKKKRPQTNQHLDHPRPRRKFSGSCMDRYQARTVWGEGGEYFLIHLKFTYRKFSLEGLGSPMIRNYRKINEIILCDLEVIALPYPFPLTQINILKIFWKRYDYYYFFFWLVKISNKSPLPSPLK